MVFSYTSKSCVKCIFLCFLLCRCLSICFIHVDTWGCAHISIVERVQKQKNTLDADKGAYGVDVNPGAEGKTVIQSRKDGIVIFWLRENGSHLDL